jgi:uncharacterized membrane protein YbhN (UPF0104 family)
VSGDTRATSAGRPVTAGGRRARLRLLAAVGAVTAVVVATGWAVTQNTTEFLTAFEQLHRLSLGWLAAAVIAEVMSYLTYAAAQRRLLAGCGYRLGTGTLTALSAAAQALGNVIPVGSAVAGLYVMRQLRRRGVEEYVGLAVQTATVVAYFGALAALALVGAQVAGPGGPVDLRVTAATVIAGSLVLMLLARRGMRRGWGLGLARRLQARWPTWPWPESAASAQVRLPTARGWVAVAGALVASWMVDCGCLAACVFAVSAAVPWRGLLVSYCAGQLAAIIPFAPGGLGVVEGSLTLALVAYGGAAQTTLAAVLLYRLITYWALLPIGALAHLGLQRTARDRP